MQIINVFFFIFMFFSFRVDLLTQNIWITPGLQFVVDPARNFENDFIAIPHLKFRVAL